MTHRLIENFIERSKFFMFLVCSMDFMFGIFPAIAYQGIYLKIFSLTIATPLLWNLLHAFFAMNGLRNEKSFFFSSLLGAPTFILGIFFAFLGIYAGEIDWTYIIFLFLSFCIPLVFWWRRLEMKKNQNKSLRFKHENPDLILTKTWKK